MSFYTLIFSDSVDKAFRYLKQDTYYDKMDLFLRAKVAEYETNPDFRIRQNRLAEIIGDFNSGEMKQESVDIIQQWLSEISYRLLPKSIESKNQNDEDKNNDKKKVTVQVGDLPKKERGRSPT